MRRALAICWRISADGLRRPRSIWLRYGLEMPARSDRRRSDNRALLRCSRMNAPRSYARSSSAIGGARLLPPPSVLGEQLVRVGRARLVPVDDLGLERVDPVEHEAPALAQAALELGQLVGELADDLVAQLGEVGERVGVGDGVDLGRELVGLD